MSDQQKEPWQPTRNNWMVCVGVFVPGRHEPYMFDAPDDMAALVAYINRLEAEKDALARELDDRILHNTRLFMQMDGERSRAERAEARAEKLATEREALLSLLPARQAKQWRAASTLRDNEAAK